MTNITVLGIDIAKTVFQFCDINRYGKVVHTQQVRRERFSDTVVKLKADRVVMKACGWCTGSH